MKQAGQEGRLMPAFFCARGAELAPQIQIPHS